MTDRSLALMPVAETGWTNIGDEVVVYVANKRQAHVLNAAGALLWPLFDGESTIGDISDDVADAFGIEPHLVIDQVLSFTESMVAVGALEPLDRAATS